MPSEEVSKNDSRLNSLRKWFFAAALYNLVWGSLAAIFPSPFMKLGGLEGSSPVLFQVIGMIVGVYAYGYYLLARAPIRYQGLVWIGLAGKTFGPIGFLVSALRGDLPWSFGWIILTNDLIWWPSFWSFALKYARRPLDHIDSNDP